MAEMATVSIVVFAQSVNELMFSFFRYIDQETGRRSDTAHHYIYNQIDTNGNLKVFCGQKVVRVLFE